MLDPRRSWAGFLGASGRGSIVPSLSTLYLADPQEVGAQGWLAVGLAVCWVGAGLGRLEAAEELVRLGRKCRIAWEDFWASMKRSAKPSTADPDTLPDKTRVSRKGTLSASFISFIVSQRWHSNTQAGHRTPDGLGGGFGGALSQVWGLGAPHPLWVWRYVKRTTVRGRGQSQSPITPPHLKPPEKRLSSISLSLAPNEIMSLMTLIMLSEEDGECSLPLRWRHVGIEPTWARKSPAAQILCPPFYFFHYLFFSQINGRKKTGAHINALFYMTLFYIPNPTQYLNLTTNLLTLNKQQIRNVLKEKS